MRTVSGIGILLISLFAAHKSEAAPYFNTIGLSGANFRLNFNEIVLPMGTVVSDQYADFGVTFETTTIPSYNESDFRYDVQGPQGGCLTTGNGTDSCFIGLNGHSIGSSGGNPVYIHFGAAQQYATFGLASNPRVMTISALLGDVVIETTTLNWTGGYYGFTGISFDSIRIESHLVHDVDNRVMIDNIQFSALPSVPEPNALGCLIGGFIGILANRKRLKPH